jgi:large subunit ribosomal protein L18
MKVTQKDQARSRRHLRIRRKVRGTADRPRLCVYVSNKHLYVQVIDDDAARTLVQASTLEGEFRGKASNREAAAAIGKRIGERAKAQEIGRVVFDRGGFMYGLRVKSLADAVRESGIEF